MAMLSLGGVVLSLFGSAAAMFGGFVIVFANGISVSMACKEYCDKPIVITTHDVPAVAATL